MNEENDTSMVQAEVILANEHNDFVRDVKCGDVVISVRSHISMRDYAEIVQTVCATCFDVDGSYRPYVEQYVLDVEILKKYTNIKMPESFDDCLKVVDYLDSYASSKDEDESVMEEIRWNTNYISLGHDVREAINFELKKYERDTHAMVQRMSNTVRSISLLAEEMFGQMVEEAEAIAEEESDNNDVAIDEEESDVQDRIMHMAVVEDGD